jgi:hypothetical protein
MQHPISIGYKLQNAAAQIGIQYPAGGLNT